MHEIQWMCGDTVKDKKKRDQYRDAMMQSKIWRYKEKYTNGERCSDTWIDIQIQ